MKERRISGWHMLPQGAFLRRLCSTARCHTMMPLSHDDYLRRLAQKEMNALRGGVRKNTERKEVFTD